MDRSPSAKIIQAEAGLRRDAQLPDWLPADLGPLFEEVMAALPSYPDKHIAAAVLSQRVYKVSARTVEAWPLAVRRVNGRACSSARELAEYAFRKVVDAPVVRGGKRQVA